MNSVLALGLTGVFFFCAGMQDAPKMSRVATQKLITKIRTFREGTLTVSPDTRRFAYARQAGSGWTVEVDGKDEATYEDIDVPESVYLSIISELALLPGWRPMAFSSDSKHFAYAARQKGAWCIVHDGKQGSWHNIIGGPVLSDDGQRLAYRAKTSGGWCVFTDGKEGKEYDKVGFPVFSPDGKHLAYAAKAGEKEMMVLDGVEGKAYESLENFAGWTTKLPFQSAESTAKSIFGTVVASLPVFSPDGRFAYVAKQAGNWHVIVDGQESEPFEDVAVSEFLRALRFSPDGKRLAFIGKKGGIRSFFLDGQPCGLSARTDISACTFSPDSQRFGFIAKSGERESVFVDGRSVGTHDSVNLLIFSPDSQHFAFIAKSGGKQLVFVDDRLIGTHDEVGLLVFSPDSARIAYAAKSGKMYALAVDGVLQKQYPGVLTPVFSPDGSHLACEVLLPTRRWVVLVDGVMGSPKAGFVKGTNIIFDDNSHLHYLAIENENILLVEEEISVEPTSLSSGSSPPNANS